MLPLQQQHQLQVQQQQWRLRHHRQAPAARRTHRLRAAQQQDTPAAAAQQQPELQVSRVSTSGGSRKAFAEAFCRLTNLTTGPVVDISPEQLAASPYPAWTPPLSSVEVQQKRPYFSGGRTWTTTDAGYLAFFVPMHLVALVGGPLTLWHNSDPAGLVALMLGGYVVTGMLGVSMSYHRQLSHKSFRTPKPLEFTLAYIGALAGMGDPIEWAKMHSWHHKHSDTPADRHSPRDGLYHSHFGWLFDESLTNTRRDQSGNTKDSLAAPWFVQESPGFYGWLRDTYMWHFLGQIPAFAGWGYLAAGDPLGYVVWGFCIRMLLTMHMTWLINSVVHVWGSQDYDTGGESSRNNALVALLVFGDGWHNSHHAFPSSARHGLEWWQLDASFLLVKALEAAGLAWDVREPTEAQKAAKRLKSPASG